MFCVTSTTIKCTIDITVLTIEVGWVRIIKNKTASKIKKKYKNLRDHQNSAIDIVADTGPPVINDIRIFFDQV